MYDFEEHIETTASPSRVWAIYSDVEGWVRWLPHLKSISFGGPFDSECGGTATVQVGMEATVAFHLENVVPERSRG